MSFLRVSDRFHTGMLLWKLSEFRDPVKLQEALGNRVVL